MNLVIFFAVFLAVCAVGAAIGAVQNRRARRRENAAFRGYATRRSTRPFEGRSLVRAEQVKREPGRFAAAPPGFFDPCLLHPFGSAAEPNTEPNAEHGGDPAQEVGGVTAQGVAAPDIDVGGYCAPADVGSCDSGSTGGE